MFRNGGKLVGAVGNLRDEGKRNLDNVQKDAINTIDKIFGHHGKSRDPTEAPGKSEVEGTIAPDAHGNSGEGEKSYADIVSSTSTEEIAPTEQLSDVVGSSDEEVKSEPNTSATKQEEEETGTDNISDGIEKIASTEKLPDADRSSNEELRTEPNGNGEKQDEAESGSKNISYADVVSESGVENIAPQEKLSDVGGSSDEEVRTEPNVNAVKQEEEETGTDNISYADVVSGIEEISPTENLSDAGGSSNEELRTEPNDNGEKQEEAESGSKNISYADVVSESGVENIAPQDKLSDAGGSSGEEVRTEPNENAVKQEEAETESNNKFSYADVASGIAHPEKLSDAGGSSDEEVRTEPNDANGEKQEEAESERDSVSFADVVSGIAPTEKLSDAGGSSEEEVRTESNSNGVKQEEAETDTEKTAPTENQSDASRSSDEEVRTESNSNGVKQEEAATDTEKTAPTENQSDASRSSDEEVRTESNSNGVKQEEAETDTEKTAPMENQSDASRSTDEEVKSEPNPNGVSGGEAETDDANREWVEEEETQANAKANPPEGRKSEPDTVTTVETIAPNETLSGEQGKLGEDENSEPDTANSVGNISPNEMLSGEQGKLGEDENSEPDVVPGSKQFGSKAKPFTDDGKSKEEEKSGPNVVSSGFEQMAPTVVKASSGKDDQGEKEPTGETQPASATAKFVVTDPLSGFGHHGVFHYLFDLVRGKGRWKGGFSYSDRLEGVLETDHTWQAKFSVLCLKLLFILNTPMRYLGNFVEDVINFFLANGGIIKTFFRLFFSPWKLVVLDREHEDYVSLNGAMDPRVALYTRRSTEENIDEADALVFPGTRYGSKFTADVLVMASKIAYENSKFVEKVVTNVWKMNFVGFFNCWNEFQRRKNTQVFVFTDRPKDARAIVVAFRGTEPFNTLDWSTDFDFSWFEFPGLGKVHVGFLEALGLGDRKRMETFVKLHKRVRDQRAGRRRAGTVSGLSSDVRGDRTKILAYDKLTTLLKELTEQHPNAQLFVTGHSLGGALANLYTALLFFNHEDTLTSRIAAVYTFGQPRVGAEDYSNYLIGKIQDSRYWRVVYSNDMIPRIPFDDPIFQFKHCGYCFYYDERKVQTTIKEAPNANYFTLNPGILVRQRIGALYDLILSCFSGWIYGPEFREGWMSILARAAGLVAPGMCSHMPSNYINAVRLGPAILESKLHEGTTPPGLFGSLFSFLQSKTEKYPTATTYHQS
ncbi:hypothetical protein R1sor_024568 [Riccia sorocarpa]|uniref:Fungal lipase-type domain-containing protein n=1 Tax=Riccia sorocarpa TaxID=122646 RepID=A0ABD3GT42_9MARC